MASAVFDASALLAHIGQEPGSDGIDELAVEALMSAVNLAEVFAKLAERGLSQDEADMIVYRYRLEVVPFDEEMARSRALSNDIPNAKLVVSQSRQAEFVVATDGR